MIIRQLNKSDREEILEMIRLYKEEQGIIFTPDFSTAAGKELTTIVEENTGTTWVCLVEGSIIGFCNAHLCHFPLIGGKELYISDLLVKMEQRGMGIGRLLLKAAEEFAIKEKCVRIMLNNGKNTESYIRSFYRKVGFTERGTFANFVKKLSL
jgi:ribosomal protein S18 acetylase RimI-like enzyme